ncbi:four-carbon acid sugar kinase family protein [Sedimentisphaera salicampi]|uniref:four-carbon acid sugar kinase family protein n=1 Tax=Sedimentisphaera salicampi TaxID=1941349 RepID=UPI000B9AB287|nr:four-carbon acid sugar kinase family protein [Sedimentisphaera salicampi]OXU15168.1 hypothetical protein SMSP1_01099 [Sedimentisphaera salicampi]
MVIAIADDFSGAAEIAGIGREYGMNVEVQTHFAPTENAELIVVDTDSRLCSAHEAAARVREIACRIKEADLSVDWIYKKTDSVLRGQVKAELEALLEAFEYRRILLSPANPSRGRVVSEGVYYINGRPLSETGFARDDEYPFISSNVAELLDFRTASQNGLLRRGKYIPSDGIWIAEAETDDDCRWWASSVDEQTIPAGAADFFSALLKARGMQANPIQEQTFHGSEFPAFFVFGSSSDYSRRMLRNAEESGCKAGRMPLDALRFTGHVRTYIEQWASEIETALREDSIAIAAIDQPELKRAECARRLTALTALLVYEVLSDIPRIHLYIEGGATSSAIVRKMGWQQLRVSHQEAGGVVEMRVEESPNQILTVKPGSYAWPQKISEILMKGKSYAN